jgi:hypothetical protein
VQRTGLENGFYGYLSLSHRVGNPPEPIEVSICHKGRRKDTTVNRSVSVPEYKRLTQGHGKSDSQTSNNLETPVVMASNNAESVAPQPSETPVPVQAEQGSAPPSNESAPASASQSAQQASDLAKENPAEYMKIFEKVVSSLPESERDVFIKGQLDNMKELERVNQELEVSKQNEQQIKGMQKDNINKTMNAIRNFFLQGADEDQKTKDLTKMETLFEQHPELHHTFAPVISCAARRVEVAESTSSALKVERERSHEERELFNRMRGIARDSAAPTYNYHGFEQSNTAKRPITENAAQSSSSVESPKKRAKQQSSTLVNDSLAQLKRHMSRSLPTRPNNIRTNEV